MKYLNKIICGDCLEVMKDMPDKSVDLVLADPPYNLNKDFENDNLSDGEYKKFTLHWIKEIKRILKDTGSLYCFGMVYNTIIQKLELDRQKFIFRNWLIWEKTIYNSGGKNFAYNHEDCLFYTKGEDYIFNLEDVKVKTTSQAMFKGGIFYKKPTTIFRFNYYNLTCPERNQHPTQKPLRFIEILIRASSNKNDLILDPFLGSGTTAVAAQNLHRNFIGIEISKEYCKIAEQRLRQKPML